MIFEGSRKALQPPTDPNPHRVSLRLLQAIGGLTGRGEGRGKSLVGTGLARRLSAGSREEARRGGRVHSSQVGGGGATAGVSFH